MNRINSVLILCVLVCGCAGPHILDDDNALVVAPLEIGSEGHIIVQVILNDRGPFRFALDTGASISVIFDTAREKAGIGLTEGKRVVIQGMIRSGTFPTSTIDVLRLGSESLTDIRVASLPSGSLVSKEIDGILGVDFLSRYAVGVSVRDQVVRLYSPSLVSQRSYRGWSSIPMREIKIGEADATAYTINLQINNIEFPALLDLGAGSNLMNWRTARALGVRPSRIAEETEISGAMETASVVTKLEVHQLRIADNYWRNKTFLISEFPIFEVLDLEDQLVAIIGPALFNERDFVLDFERKRMLLGASRKD
jgi:predicted aspartyl protease